MCYLPTNLKRRNGNIRKYFSQVKMTVSSAWTLLTMSMTSQIQRGGIPSLTPTTNQALIAQLSQLTVRMIKDFHSLFSCPLPCKEKRKIILMFNTFSLYIFFTTETHVSMGSKER
jgi:hypothetical protein